MTCLPNPVKQSSYHKVVLLTREKYNAK